MVKNFKRMISNLRREDRASEAAQYDFFPVTYLLPMEYGVFVEDFKRQADKPIWIAKPTGKAQVNMPLPVLLCLCVCWHSSIHWQGTGVCVRECRGIICLLEEKCDIKRPWQGKGIFLFTDLKEVKLWKKASENRSGFPYTCRSY